MTEATVPARPPIAPVGATVHELHGVRRVDDYAGLRDIAKDETLAYLAAERALLRRAGGAYGAPPPAAVRLDVSPHRPG